MTPQSKTNWENTHADEEIRRGRALCLAAANWRPDAIASAEHQFATGIDVGTKLDTDMARIVTNLVRGDRSLVSN